MKKLIPFFVAIATILILLLTPPVIGQVKASTLDSTQYQSNNVKQIDGKTMDKRDTITQVLNTYVEGWVKGDANILKSIWDLSHEQATYLPAEYAEAIKGPENIAAYYDQSAQNFPTSTINLQEPVIDILDDDYVQVYCAPEWVTVNSDGSKATIYPRLSFTMKRSGDRWLVIHYHESLQYKDG